MFTPFALSLGHQRQDSVLDRLLLSLKAILTLLHHNRYLKQWCKQRKFLSLTWHPDTKHSCTRISHNSEGVQARGQIHQSQRNGGQSLMLRALLCFSVFLHFQLPTVFLIPYLRKAPSASVFYPSDGSFSLAIEIVLCTSFAEDPRIKQHHTVKSGQCRMLTTKVCLFV